MERTVHEIAELCGVSVRTLHYYDEIGLLHPSRVTDAGYRLYDDAAVSRLQQILFFRELDFPLKSIAGILDSPAFDRREAFVNHKRLLELKRERLNRLIRLVEENLKGEINMSTREFDMGEIEATREQYADEVKSRWGNTSAYAESTAKAKGYGPEDWDRIQRESDVIWDQFARLLREGVSTSGEDTRAAVRAWQQHLTTYYYQCTREILAGLGEMYIADERFTRNLDSRYGKGVAAYASEAIREFCKTE